MLGRRLRHTERESGPRMTQVSKRGVGLTSFVPRVTVVFVDSGLGPHCTPRV